MRDLVVTILVMIVVGLALPFGVLIALWYLPVPRTWWSLAIFVVNLLIPTATGLVAVPRLRRLGRQVNAERSARQRADRLSRNGGHHPRAT
jgi:membrane protein YdbS with pleckstrin-like domain